LRKHRTREKNERRPITEKAESSPFKAALVATFSFARGSLLQISGLNVRKEAISIMAAGDLGGDYLDTILDQYRAQSSTSGLLTEYLAGEKDSSINLNNLKKQLKEASVNLLLASEFQCRFSYPLEGI
jgi:hypothetical protein